jgi:hypothetical protein
MTGRIALVLCLACAACSSRPPALPDTRLRIAVEVPADLTTCRYAPTERFVIEDLGERRRRETRIGERAVDVELGPAAVERIGAVLEEEFVVTSAEADLVARPRIASAHTARSRSLAGVDASITYAVAFLTPSGQLIADVSGSGSASFEYPLLINLGRLVLHLGTLFLFDQVDSDYIYGRAFRRAEAEAAAALHAALARAPELREYAAAQRAGRQPETRDAEIDRLLDTVLASRPGTVAVLDLEPIADAPTVVESYLAEEIRTRLARKGVQTLERAVLVHALEELQLSMTDLVDPTHAPRFGQLVAADAILTGTTARFPHEMKLSLRLLATETARVIGAGATRLSTHGAFPSADGRPQTAAVAPACPAPAGTVWVGPSPTPAPVARGWRSY